MTLIPFSTLLDQKERLQNREAHIGIAGMAMSACLSGCCSAIDVSK